MEHDGKRTRVWIPLPGFPGWNLFPLDYARVCVGREANLYLCLQRLAFLSCSLVRMTLGLWIMSFTPLIPVLQTESLLLTQHEVSPRKTSLRMNLISQFALVHFLGVSAVMGVAPCVGPCQ